MARNTKILTEEDLCAIENMYHFYIVGDYVIAESKSMNRKVMHNKHEDFALNTKIKLVKISKEAINYWEQIGSVIYSLIRVQNIINILECSYQEATLENVVDFLLNDKK